MINHSGENNGRTPASRPSKTLRRAYTLLSSTTTAVCVLCLMTLFYLLGTVFPQGLSLAEYEKSGGAFVFLVTVFDLLELFTTPVFLALAFILLLNLLVCACDRFPSLLVKWPYPAEFTPDHSIALTQEPQEAKALVREVFVKELGFRPAESAQELNAVEKGLPCAILRWLLHAGVAVCVLAFVLTYLFAYEGTMRLLPQKASTVVPQETGRLKSLWTEKDPPTDFHLYLDGFETEYTEYPDLYYPEQKAARLAIGLGWASPSYELREDSLFVTGWKARIKAIRGKNTLYEKTALAGSPLKYGGYTFYLAGWTGTVRVSVDGNPMLLEAPYGEEVFVPGLSEPIAFGDVKSGKVLRLNGRVDDLRPFTTVTVRSAGGYSGAAKVRLGDSVTLNGHTVTPALFQTGAVIKYRYDPGVEVLWAGCILFLMALALRTFIGGSTAFYEIVEENGIAFLKLTVSAEGLRYSPERTVAALTKRLTVDDIRPEEIPDLGEPE